MASTAEAPNQITNHTAGQEITGIAEKIAPICFQFAQNQNMVNANQANVRPRPTAT
jgi:hypothetical protein